MVERAAQGDLSHNYAALIYVQLGGPGVTIDDALSKFGVTNEYRPSRGLDAEDLLALLDEGMSKMAIHRLTGLSPTTIRARIRKYLKEREVMPLCQEAPPS